MDAETIKAGECLEAQEFEAVRRAVEEVERRRVSLEGN